jgi:uncharacterized membrane protein
MPIMSPATLSKATVAAAAAAIALSALEAQAQINVPKPTYKFEKCYGVAKGAQNDCFTTVNACGGTALKDNDPNAWIYVPAGVCKKLAGGKLSPGAIKPAKSG